MNTFSRRVAATSAALLSLSALTGTTSAQAAPLAATTQVWASFVTPAAPQKADNLRWYVASPTVTSAMVGKQVTVVANPPARIDCPRTGAGFDAGKGWVNTPLKRISCTSTQLVTSFTATKAMLDTRVAVNGWTAAGNRTSATVTGAVSVNKLTGRGANTAVRAAAPKPVGPLTLLGTYQGRRVSIASAGGVNEIWVGTGARAVRYESLAGDTWHVGVQGSRVDLWTRDGNVLHQWHLDLATGAITTSDLSVINGILHDGAPGFWAVTPQTPWKSTLFAWSGAIVALLPGTDTGSHPERGAGFTKDVAVYDFGGMLATGVVMMPTDGRPAYRVDITGHISGMSQPDATGVNITYFGIGATPDGSCRITYGSSTCPGTAAFVK